MARLRSLLLRAGLAISTGQAVIVPAVVATIAVALISWAVGPKRGDIRVDVALASLAAFLFGVLLAFTIARTRERLSLVQDLVAKGNAALFSIYQAMEVFGDADRDNIRTLIDAHLTDQIDYRLVDYHLGTASHLSLTEAIYALDPQTPQQEAVYKELITVCISLRLERGHIESAGGQALSPIEWSGLLLLLFVLVSLIAVLPGGTVLGAIVAGLLSGALFTFMILLRRLDLLRWHERVSIWEPTTRLFRSMGQYPYIPRHVIDAGRYRPTGRIRIVDYPDPYPNRSTKVVTVVDLSEREVIASGDGHVDLTRESSLT